MHHCSSEWIVSFYGAFLADVHVGICMEYMDRGLVVIHEARA
jgi:mitogen-activated protein kinase kinase